MRVVLLQPPAWGLGNPADTLARALGVPRICFGNLMRAHIRERARLGARCAAVLERGGPFPDGLLTAVVRDHLEHTAPSAFLLHGHPPNAAQALALDALLHELGTPLERVVRLRLPEQEAQRLVRRLAGRRLCREDPTHCYEPPADAPTDGAVPVTVGGVCGACGGELYQRKDDRKDSVLGRFRSHDAMAQPIARHYADRGLLVTVDVVGTPEEAAGRALAALAAPGRHGH